MSLRPVFTGRSHLSFDVEAGLHSLMVAVTCELGAGAYFDALLDTASEWCILGADEFGLVSTEAIGEPARLTSRFGRCEGLLVRSGLTFPAIEGNDLHVEATWFV